MVVWLGRCLHEAEVGGGELHPVDLGMELYVLYY